MMPCHVTPIESTVGRVRDEVLCVCRSRPHRHDAGVRDDDVEPTKLGERGLEDFAQLSPLAHVGLLCDNSAPKLLDLSFCLRQIVGRRQGIAIRFDVVTDVDGDDVGTFFGHLNSVCASLAPSGPGYERYFSVKPTTHQVHLSCWTK